MSGGASREKIEVLIRRARETFDRGDFEECVSLLDKVREKCGPSFPLEHNARLARLALARSRKQYNELVDLDITTRIPSVHGQSLSAAAAYAHALFLAQQHRPREALVVLAPMLEGPRDHGHIPFILLAIYLAVEIRDIGALPKLITVARNLVSAIDSPNAPAASTHFALPLSSPAGPVPNGNAGNAQQDVMNPSTSLAGAQPPSSSSATSASAPSTTLTITSSLRLLEMLSMTLAADLPKALSYMDTHMPAEEPMSVEWVLWTLTRARVLWEMGNLVQCLALLQQCQIRLQSARQRSTVSSTSGAKTSSSGNATDSASDEAVLYLPHVLNNLAIVYGAMGKTNLSLMHLQMAGSVANAMRPSLRLDILADRTPDILYNMGLAMLGQLRASPISELSSSLLAPSPKVAASTSSSSSGGVGASRLPASGASLASGFGGSATGSPLPHANTALHAAFAHRLQQIDNAFRCFRTAALHLSHLPSLFLRMAELCFLRHQISQILSAQPLYDVVCIHACPTPGAAGRSSASGSGYDKGFLALQLHTQQHSLFASAGTDGHESGMSLQQARLYLQTALGLRPRAVVLRFHILLALTYCCLMLGDYYAALRYASLCLELPDGTVDGRVCVSLYAAECLCRLDRAKEAMRFLVPRVLEPLLQGTMALSTAPQSQTVQSLQSAKMEAFLRARAALYVNLASCLMLQGMFDKARAANAKALEMAPGLPAAIVNEAYIALALGEHDRALRLFQAFRL